MAVKLDILDGTDWVNGDILFAGDLIDTFEATVKGIEETIEDSALVASATTTYTLPTRRTWERIKVYITASTTAGGTITNFRLNGNSGGANYKYIQRENDGSSSQNILSDTKITNTQVGAASFLRLANASDAGSASGEFVLVNDRVYFKSSGGNYVTPGNWGGSEGIMDVATTDITSVSFTVPANMSGRIKIIGVLSL